MLACPILCLIFCHFSSEGWAAIKDGKRGMGLAGGYGVGKNYIFCNKNIKNTSFIGVVPIFVGFVSYFCHDGVIF